MKIFLSRACLFTVLIVFCREPLANTETSAPAKAQASAKTAPDPLLPPVINTTLSFNVISGILANRNLLN